MNSWPLHKFHGGIHPAENKEQSNQLAIQKMPLPAKLVVPVLQHAGQPAEPCVAVGDKVLKGQLIAANNATISAAVHAPSSGEVTAIGDFPYPHPSGESFLAIEITTDGQDQWVSELKQREPANLSNAEIFELINSAGISGMGGAGFPTDIKLRGTGMAGIETLIINGTECEPFITADDMLMREQPERVLAGIDILVQLTAPKQVLIAIEDNKPEAISAMRQALGVRPYQIVELPTLYPSGGERQLTKILTGAEVPSGGLPINVGVICQNVATAAAVYDAVVLDKPLISRITTLTGAALNQPQNVECLIGTSVRELLEFACVNQAKLSRVISGGPMMGFSLNSLDVPATKTSNCFIATTEQELPTPSPALPCIRCGQCELVCPSNLLPQQLLFFAMGEQHEQLQAHNLFDCIECGSCAYVCSSKIPLVQYYRAAKADIREQEQKQQKSEHARLRFEFRQQRIEAEEAQKAAERQARNERLARVKAAQEAAAAQKQAQDAAADTTNTGAQANEDEIKRLKIAASMAKVALRKAEKQLTQHGTPELEQQVQQLKQAAEQAEQQLTQAQTTTENSSATPAETATATATATADDELKKAKIKLAMQRAALRKAEKNQAEETELEQLRSALSAAEQQLAKLEAANTP